MFKKMRTIDLYNTAGFLSDGLGGLLLLLFGSALYGIIGAAYTPGYQQIVFGFVFSVGMIHLMGLIFRNEGCFAAKTTVILRVMAAAGFFALYKAGILGWIAYAIAGVDLLFVLIYLLLKGTSSNGALKDSCEKTTLT